MPSAPVASDPLLHLLCDATALPPRLNNPFYYEPDDLSRAAIHELTDYLYGRSSAFSATPLPDAFRADIDRGKMMGVLVVTGGQRRHHLSYLAAYSGQVCGRSDWPGFVPAVFDYLQPDGYFKTHEAEITQLNHEAGALAEAVADEQNQGAEAIDDPRPVTHKARLTEETDEAYIRRRQFENAELHRWKLRQRDRQNRIEADRQQKTAALDQLCTLRRQKSDDLQRWLFRHFQMRNARGETSDLIDITRAYQSSSGLPNSGLALLSVLSHSGLSSSEAKPQSGGVSILPPAGSGECCEPKLLQYAFLHGLRPVSMAMFWWGESPKTEVRHHLQCYPACNGKCKPILWWMLQGLDVAPNPLDDASRDAALAARLRTLYDDADICVVSKPAGLLAVPGKSGRESVLSLMRRRFPDAPSPLIVHRLDMDTSGLMVIAKTMAAYHDLQRQFAAHTIQKRYVAIVEGQPKRDEGVISLPLRPDLDDRPRQVVDPIHGRPALTTYHVVARFDDGRSRLWLYPHTGRTHQLRVHCAHADGLGCPIVGDALYGTGRLIQGDVRCGSGRLIQGDVRCGSGRLCLHAEQLTFRHPTTGRTMTFTDKPPF